MKKILNLIIVIFISTNCIAQTIENQILSSINQHRKANGLAPYTRNKNLDKAALHHAKYVALSGNQSHEETVSIPNFELIRNLEDRVTRYGAGAIAENIVGSPIAYFHPSTKDSIFAANNVVEAWKKSPGHNANLLLEFGDKYPFEIGIGIYEIPKKKANDTRAVMAVMVVGNKLY